MASWRHAVIIIGLSNFLPTSHTWLLHKTHTYFPTLSLGKIQSMITVPTYLRVRAPRKSTALSAGAEKSV